MFKNSHKLCMIMRVGCTGIPSGQHPHLGQRSYMPRSFPEPQSLLVLRSSRHQSLLLDTAMRCLCLTMHFIQLRSYTTVLILGLE